MSDLFDQLTKQIGQATSRRDALRALGAGLFGLAFGSLGAKQAVAADPATSPRCRSECQTKCSTRDPKTSRVTTNFACLRDCVAACNLTTCGTKLTNPCGMDDVTIDAIKRARLALAGGADDVPLSQQGCARYTRIRGLAGEITSEVISYAGRPSLVWKHTSSYSESTLDADLDGCPERRTRITKGATRSTDKITIEDIEPGTGATRLRTSYTRNHETVQVLVEAIDATGVLSAISKFDLGLFIGATIALNCTTQCTSQQCDSETLNGQLRKGIERGIECMSRRGFARIDDLARTLLLNSFSVECANDFITKSFVGGNIAALNPWDAIVGAIPGDVVTIYVNPDLFCCLSENDQESVLFHEFLHVDLPLHLYSSTDDHVDQILACQSLCFDFPRRPDRCSCALCLGTSPTSSQCSDLGCCAGQQLCGSVCCPSEKICSNNQCIDSCPSGKDNCPTGCKDLKKDPQNCGACGKTCGKCQACVNGKCEQKDCGQCAACDNATGNCVPIATCCSPGQDPCTDSSGFTGCCSTAYKCCPGAGCAQKEVVCCKNGYVCNPGTACSTAPNGLKLCCPPDRPLACKDGCRLPGSQKYLPPGYCA